MARAALLAQVRCCSSRIPAARAICRSPWVARCGAQSSCRSNDAMACGRAWNSTARATWMGNTGRMQATANGPGKGRTQMSVVLGSGEHRYRVVENWAKLPDGWSFKDVAAVAVDSKDQVYVFNRGEHPMMVFDRDGNFMRSWGEGVFRRAHGLDIDAHDTLYCTDDGDHTVRKCTTLGRIELTIGVPGKPAPFMSGEPFHRCTHTALSPKGDIYVSD